MNGKTLDILGNSRDGEENALVSVMTFILSLINPDTIFIYSECPIFCKAITAYAHTHGMRTFYRHPASFDAYDAAADIDRLILIHNASANDDARQAKNAADILRAELSPREHRERISHSWSYDDNLYQIINYDRVTVS